MHQAERGAFDLRRGHIVRVVDEPVIGGPSGVAANGHAAADSILIGAAETLVASQAAELQRLGGQTPQLLMTASRATGLGLADPGIQPVTLAPPSAELLTSLLGLSPETLSDAARARLRASMRPATRLEASALELAKAAQLIPALIFVPLPAHPNGELAARLADQSILSVPTSQAERLLASAGSHLVRVIDAPVPLEDAPQARFVLFRERSGLLEHVAVLIGDPDQWSHEVPVRLHSACLTGDLFGSLRCDCGEQLRNSVREIAAQGGGALLYLAQEGRGIGLANKLRAYNMQDQGLDTLDADLALGFRDDERRYDSAVAMLTQLGIERIRLFTNNPNKVAALESGGIHVAARAALHGSINPHNLRYLHTKAHRAGHLLDALLEPANRKAE